MYNTTSEFNTTALSAVTVMVGTNQANVKALLERNPNELVFASDNLETLAHYYEGCAVALEVELDVDVQMDYVRNKKEINSMGIPSYNYTWGRVKMSTPKDATWYSFSGEYLKTHLVSVKEFYPDLSQFNEE